MNYDDCHHNRHHWCAQPFNKVCRYVKNGYVGAQLPIDHDCNGEQFVRPIAYLHNPEQLLDNDSPKEIK